MIGSVKRQKAGFRYSEVNVTPQTNLGELMQKLQAASQEMGVVTNDGTPAVYSSASSQRKISIRICMLLPIQWKRGCGQLARW